MRGTREATSVGSVAFGLTIAVPMFKRLVVSEPKMVLSNEMRPPMTAEFESSGVAAVPVLVVTKRVVWAGGLSSKDKISGPIVRPGAPNSSDLGSRGSPFSTWR